MSSASDAKPAIAEPAAAADFERHLMWRTLSWAFAAGAVFALIGSVGFPDDRREVVVGLSSAGVCAGTAALLRLAPHRLPGWFAHALVACGTLVISLTIYGNLRIANDDELFYLWVAIFAFYFFSREAALLHMALVAPATGWPSSRRSPRRPTTGCAGWSRCSASPWRDSWCTPWPPAGRP